MDRCAYILWKRTSRSFVKVTSVWLFRLSEPKSAVFKRALHAEWHSLMSQPSQDTRALLGQVTGSVAPNKPAVHTEAVRAGCRSACINFTGLQGLAVSTVVTIAEPRCLLGSRAVTPATVMSTQEAEHFFSSLSFQHHLALLRPISNSSGMCEELTCLCGSMCERRKSRSGSWQLLRAPSLRWQMCHIVRAATCLAAANRLTMALFVTRLLFLSLFFPLSATP